MNTWLLLSDSMSLSLQAIFSLKTTLKSGLQKSFPSYARKNNLFDMKEAFTIFLIERKYLSDKGKKIGFYTGITALQQAGLSTQISNVPEIQTNNENSKLRRVKVGSQEIILRKARTKINNENIAVLQFLEIMNSTAASYFDDVRKAILKEWIRKRNITRQLVTEYAPVFPDRTMRNLVESGVIYYVA